MHQATMQSGNSPQPALRTTDSPEESPGNKDGPEPKEELSPGAEPAEDAVEGSEEPRDEMTLDINSFRKPGEKTFTQRSRLFVGNLPVDIPEEEFKDMFAKYGNISEVFINRERGFGFIRLVSPCDLKGVLESFLLYVSPQIIMKKPHFKSCVCHKHIR